MAGYVSSVSWFLKGQIYLRVYTSTGTKITERCWDKDKWYTGAFSAEGSAVGGTGWLDSGGQIHLRIYVCNPAGQIVEKCWDKDKWYDGAFASQTNAKGTGASASSWYDGGQVHIRVYVRNSDGSVTEYCWDTNKWYKGGYTG
ncbi:MAG: hypothetical protein WA584_18925 [Pyrinomonadaceae bacterium]